ncbi:MAG: hypothetical protein R2684_01925 [Pyrinomonadaceae bacterium]
MISKKLVKRIGQFAPMKENESPHRGVQKLAVAGLLAAMILMANGCGLFRSERRPITLAATFLRDEKSIGEPFGVAIDNSRVFFSDGENGKVFSSDDGAKPILVADGFATPSGIAIGPNGSIIVADSGDSVIYRIVDGEKEIVAGTKGVAGLKDGAAKNSLFRSPVGVAVDGEKIYVADTYNDRIRVIENDEVKTVAGGERGFRDSEKGKDALFDTPSGLCVYEGRVFVADFGNRRIRVIDPKGGVETIAGNGNWERRDGLPFEASFAAPTAVTIDSSGTLLVADGDSVRGIGSGIIPLVQTLSGGEKGYRDGRPSQARFNRVSGLASFANGDIVATDSDNGSLRVLTSIARGKVLNREVIAKLGRKARDFRQSEAGRWPYQPPEKAREIAGTLGEIRGKILPSNREPAWFHNGLDIVGGYGEKARAVRDEKILRVSSVSEFGTLRENLRFPQLGYIHIRFGRDAEGNRFDDKRFVFNFAKDGKPKGVRVPRGSRFRPGEVLGTLNSMNHVHLIAGPSGKEMNALDALELPGVSDSRTPVIEKVEIIASSGIAVEAGEASEPAEDVARIAVDGKSSVIVTAYDQMDGNAERRRLGVYKLGYQILNDDKSQNSSFPNVYWSISFEKMPRNEFVPLVYANGSSSGATGTTVFNYIVTNHVDGDIGEKGYLKTNGLKPGNYVLRVFAADYFGNTAEKDLNIVLR